MQVWCNLQIWPPTSWRGCSTGSITSKIWIYWRESISSWIHTRKAAVGQEGRSIANCRGLFHTMFLKPSLTQYLYELLNQPFIVLWSAYKVQALTDCVTWDIFVQSLHVLCISGVLDWWVSLLWCYESLLSLSSASSFSDNLHPSQGA